MSGAASVLVALSPMTLQAQEKAREIPLDPIEISEEAPGGTRTYLGSGVETLPASTYLMSGSDIENKHVGHYTDVFRDVPGMVVSNYGQGGLASGVTMRGYSAWSHGQDMNFTVDGVPVNEVSGVHSQNYPDLNIVLPETVERIDIVRGPFAIEYGDGNVAGSAAIHTKSRMRPQTSFQGGSFGTARAFGGYSHEFMKGESNEIGVTSFVTGELYQSEGYRDNSEEDRYNLFGKATAPVRAGAVSVRAQIYNSDWGSPDYLRTDFLNAGTLSERDAVSETDGGFKESQIVAVNYTPDDFDNGWTGAAYVIHSDFARIRTNPTSLNQQRSEDSRWTYGANGKRVWTGESLGMPTQFMLGGTIRGDRIQATRWDTTNGSITGADLNADVVEHGVGGFGQVQVKPHERVKLTAGLRYDYFFYDVDDNLASANSTTTDTGVVSPKFGIAFQATDTLELFANYGESFRSPNAVSELRSNPDLEAQKVHSHEVGFRLGGLPLNAELHGSVWYTRQSNEIFNNGGTPENLGESERDGYDVGVAVPVVRERDTRLTFNADYSFVKARLVGRGTSVFVPTVPTYVAQLGVNGVWALPNERSLHGNLGTQFYGKQHLDSTGDLEADPYYVVTGKLTYRFLEGWSGFGSFRWYPDERYSEIALPVSGVWGTGPQPELTMLFGIGKEF